MQQQTGDQVGRGGTRPRPPSIRDVARLAGVSHQTVSRVLNGHPSIRDVTRARVRRAMSELQFRPSRAARALSTRRSRMIGVLAAGVTSQYGPASSVMAVEDAARRLGYYATVAHLASASAPAITTAVEDLLGQDVEGIVLVAPRVAVLSRLAALPMNVPIVAAQGQPDKAGGIPVARVDQEAGVRMLLDYLIECGHRRILHLAGPRDWSDALSRMRACKARLRAAGLPVLPPAYGDWTAASGYQAGRAILSDAVAGTAAGRQSGGRPALPFTAVFSSNDQMALGLIHAFREAGLDVPRDVSVVGFDDIPEAAHFWPPLTTIRQDFAELGVLALTMLVDAICRVTEPGDSGADGDEGGPAVRETAEPVAPVLVVRDSVARV